MKYIEIFDDKKLGDVVNASNKLVTFDNEKEIVNDNKILKEFYETYKNNFFSYDCEDLRKIYNDKKVTVVHKVISKDYKEFIFAPYSYKYFDYTNTNKNNLLFSVNEILEDFKEQNVTFKQMNYIIYPNYFDIDYLAVELVDSLDSDDKGVFKIENNIKTYIFNF